MNINDLKYTLYSLLVVTRVDNLGVYDKIYYDILKSYFTEQLDHNNIKEIIRGEKFELTLLNNKCIEVEAYKPENNGYYDYSYKLLNIYKKDNDCFNKVYDYKDEE